MRDLQSNNIVYSEHSVRKCHYDDDYTYVKEEVRSCDKIVTLHGLGCLTFDNATYIGEFDMNVISGFGIMNYNNGYVYEGEWQHDKKHGYGRMNYCYYEYEGEWADDLYDGRGTLKYSTGRVVEGIFEKGLYYA